MRQFEPKQQHKSGGGFRNLLCPLLGAVILMGPLRSLCGQTPNGSGDDALLRQGLAAAQAGQLTQAESIFEALRKRHPDSFEINEYLGVLYASDDKPALALPRMRAAVSENPSSDAAHANLGMAYLKAGDAHQAVEELERAVQLHPEQPAAEEALGESYLLLHEPSKAASAFAWALRTEGKKPDLIYNAALASLDSGDPAGAAALLARMPNVDQSAAAQSLYADTEEQLGHYADAAQHYLNAIRLEPSEANYTALGNELLRHWNFARALQAFEEGVQHYPASETLQFGLGVASYTSLDYAKAIQTFAAMLRKSPLKTDVAEMLGRSCSAEAAGNHSECEELFRYAAEHPENAQVDMYAAVTLMHEEANSTRVAQIAELLQHAIAAAPNDPEILLQQGIFLQTQSRWEQSIPVLEQSVRLRSDSASAHYRLGLAFAHMGQHARAQQEIVLHQKYSAQEKKRLDDEMKQVVTIVLRGN